MNAFTRSLLLALTIPFVAYSQKLPSKQSAGLHIPTNFKIDGKASEWNNVFQAYNSSIEAFYTIANDRDKLYLIVQVTDPLVIRKLVAGGLTFSINKSDSRKEKPLVAITYPIFEKKNIPNVNWKNKPVAATDPTTTFKLDSFMNVANKQVVDKSKEIKITGKLLQDSVISVYNEVGIKAVSSFDNKIRYTYELLIPFDRIGLPAGQKKFYYNIKLNGSDHDGTSSIEFITGGVRVNGPGKMEDMNFIWNPTDLWGEYILPEK
ncbi:hypothetical protein GCM10027049_29080 [Mucilaginibacter puniceus]